MQSILLRFARCRGPFLPSQAAQRFGLSLPEVEAALNSLVAQGKLVLGGFLPQGHSPEYCEVEVLRRIRTRSLAKLRREVAPVEAATFASFLAHWQGVGSEGRGQSTLREVVALLEGLPLPLSELERSILPARVTNFSPRQLDELGMQGELVWVGAGPASTSTRQPRVY